MGTPKSWVLKGFVSPWEGLSFARPGLILLYFTNNLMCRKLGSEKAAGFGFYFVFQCQLWNIQTVLIEQKFPSNLMSGCQDFSVQSFLNRRWTLVNTLKGNMLASLELIPPFLLTTTDTSPWKSELHKAVRSERKKLLWQSQLYCQVKQFILPLHLPSSHVYLN